MYAQEGKPNENKSRVVANSVAQKEGDGKQEFGFVDNREVAVAQKEIQRKMESPTLIISSQNKQNDSERKRELAPRSIKLNDLNKEDYVELASASTKIIANALKHIASARGVSVTVGIIKETLKDLVGIGTILDSAQLAYCLAKKDNQKARAALVSLLASITKLDTLKKILEGLIELDGGDGKAILLSTKAYKKILSKYD